MNKNILFLLLGAGLVLVLAVVRLNIAENQASVEENEPIEGESLVYFFNDEQFMANVGEVLDTSTSEELAIGVEVLDSNGDTVLVKSSDEGNIQFQVSDPDILNQLVEDGAVTTEEADDGLKEVAYSYPIEHVEDMIDDANAVDQVDQVEIDSDIVYQSEAMNTETFLNRLSIDMGLDSEEAISLVSEQTNLDIDNKNINGTEATFRVFSQTIHVDEEYSVNIHIYCQTQEADGSVEVLNVIAANMFPSDKADSKAFGGSIFVNIEDSETIYCSVNGEFYEEDRYIEPEISPSSDTMLTVSFVPDDEDYLTSKNVLAPCYVEGRMNIEDAH